MTLSATAAKAITLLDRYDMDAKTLAPFWYRQYVRLAPQTPLPMWGASKGYWNFLAVVNSLQLGAMVTVAMTYLTWERSVTLAAQNWGFTIIWLSLVWLGSGVMCWLDVWEKRCNFRREADVLKLPPWNAIPDSWRPALEDLRLRAEPTRYWLRSLWGDPLVHRMAWLGSAAFSAVALAFPHKAGSYGEVTALAYFAISLTGAVRTIRYQPMPQSAKAWQCTNGFWIGSIAVSLVWHVFVASALGYPAGANTMTYAAMGLAVHAWEWLRFSRQSAMVERVTSAEQSRQLAEARLHTLKSQIAPHFIFNTIAHLKALIATDPAMAQIMADELSDFLRSSMASLQQDRVSVAQEFELVRAYLELTRMRMGERLQVSLDLQSDAATWDIPPLLVQTLVENAVQHGIEPKPGMGSITVTAHLDTTPQGPSLVVCVADDGVGFGNANTSGSGIGLANVRQRLATTYGGKAKLTLTVNTPQGVVATISIPQSKNP